MGIVTKMVNVSANMDTQEENVIHVQLVIIKGFCLQLSLQHQLDLVDLAHLHQ